MKSTRPMGAEA